jgi:hypothetical protein
MAETGFDITSQRKGLSVRKLALLLTSAFCAPSAFAQTCAPGSLNYSIPDLPPGGHSLLLQKPDGSMAVMAWNEGGNATRTVNLGGAYDSVQVIDPTQTRHLFGRYRTPVRSPWPCRTIRS